MGGTGLDVREPPEGEDDQAGGKATKGTYDGSRQAQLDDRERRCRCVGEESHHQTGDGPGDPGEHRAHNDGSGKKRQGRECPQRFHGSSVGPPAFGWVRRRVHFASGALE